MRIAVLGLGFMGATHVKAWMQVPGAEVVAVASDEERRLKGDLSGVQGNVGGPAERMDFSGMSAYRDWEEAVRDPGAEAVDICLPTNLHEPAALAALRAGKHVLVEKPMALDAAAAERMIAEARRNGRVLMAAQVLRFFPAYRALAEQVKTGALGPVRTATFRRRCAAPGWSAWLGDKNASGGAVLDLLIHDIDMCLYLFGPPDFISASGYEDLGRGIDVIAAHWHYADKTAVIDGGWHHAGSYPFSMEYTVVCRDGTLDYSSAGTGVSVYSPAGGQASLPSAGKDGYLAEIEYFHECCRRSEPPSLCPPEDSASAIRLAFLMMDARKRQGEKIPCRL